MPKNRMDKVRIGRIMNHNDGVGFKITFKDNQQARWYKKMMVHIIRSDYLHRNITVDKGYVEDEKDVR